MSYFKIGFHCGPGGNARGIGKPSGYMPTLDAARIPHSIKSVDDYGVVGESCEFSQANHQRLFRLVSNSQFDYDTPKYNLTPKAAAGIHWQATLAGLPPEFDKESVWLEVINEPDQDRDDWVGEFGYEISLLAIADGYKVALFGWSTGTPTYDSWFEPGMVKFLKLAAQHPDRIAVALHEYSLDVNDIMNGYPYLIGRFIFLHEACDEQRIARPTVFITEFGWTYNDVPDEQQAMIDLLWAANEYAPHANILSATTWYLGGGFGGIADQVQPLIEPVTNLALNYVPPPIIPPPDPPPEKTFEQFFWDLSIENQCISLNAEAALQSAIAADGLQQVGTEKWDSYDNSVYAYMGAEDLKGVIPRRTYITEVPPPGGAWQVFWLYAPEDVVVEPPEFKLTHWPADLYYVSQYYGDRPAYYSKYCDSDGVCLPGHNGWDIVIPVGGRVKAAVTGEVIWVSNTKPSGGPSDYGWHVRVKTGDYTVIYAHLAANPPVSVGDRVIGGQVIGFSGNTGVSSGPHLHFEIRHCPTSESEWPWCIIDCSPFLEPLREIQPEPNNVDMLPYFQVVPAGVGPFYVLQHDSGVTENIQHQIETGEVYIVKNSQYEHLRVTNSHVERQEDTSPGDNKFYTLDDGYGWSRWCPRYWRPGDVFHRSPDVRVYEKGDQKPCNMIDEDLGVGSWLRFEEWLPTWTSPASDASPNGITLAEVSHFSFAWSHDGDSLEDYWFAKGIGLVQWKNNQGAHSWISEIPPGRTPLSREVINCL